MKKFILSLICTAVLGAGALGVAGVSASASGNETNGMVTISENEVMPFAVENVGGGTWDYGRSGLVAYSKYYHRDRVHGSSVKIGNQPLVPDYNVPRGEWSVAEDWGLGTVYAYWQVN